jgi:large subunit ribosomal protein L24
MAEKIRKGDKVIVITGDDKGKIGIVKRVLTDKRRAFVEGVNVKQKFKKVSPENNSSKFIETSVHLSNLAVINEENKFSRIGFKSNENGLKVRFWVKTGKLVDV